REQYIEIQDLKAQLQDKNIAISELKKLIKKGKGKSVDTKFDEPSVVRQPNAQRIPQPSVLGKPALFSNSLERIYFSKTKSVPKTNVLEGVNHNTNVSRPQHKINQLKDKVLPNNSQVKPKKTQVEVHPRIPSISNKMKSVTACKDNLNSRTLNANAVCATCNKCLDDSNHFDCVTKMLNNVHARTKKPNVLPISTRKPKGQVNKLTATPYKKKVASKSTSQKPQSYFRMLYEQTNLTSSTPLCLMAKALPTQAWLWHRRLSHLNFDYINLLSKKDILIGLPKLKYVKDQLCSSYELSKAKGSSFNSKAVPSLKGRLNLLHIELCGPMQFASINGKKYILVIVDDYSRYNWTLFLRSKIVQLILFIVDSGCTKHMTGNLTLLCNFVEKYMGTVRFGNDQFAPIPGYGDLVQGNIMINRVYYVEGLNHNLFSVVNFVMRIWRLLSENLLVLLEFFRETIYSPVTVDLITIQFPFKKQILQLQYVSWLKPHQLKHGYGTGDFLILTLTTSTCFQRRMS
nr:retrovirus-related Pol polyprotein from transposon TNT 1-94 [Tanacetum cinerariifolium]